jgi:hypothetical protein
MKGEAVPWHQLGIRIAAGPGVSSEDRWDLG